MPELPARPRAALVANLLLCSLMTGFLLFLFEVGLRRFRPLASSQYSYRIPDPTLGWRLRPNAHAQLRDPEYSHVVIINSPGWRCVDHNLARTAGVRRIVLLGDSFMEGYSVDLDHTFARLLEKELNRSIPTEVINLGVGGYGTLQEYLAFTQEGRRYEPDIVLLGFLPANDSVDNSYTLQQELWEGAPEREQLFGRPSARLGAGDGFEVVAPDIQRAVVLAEDRRRRERSAPWWERTELFELGRRTWSRLRRGTDAGAAGPRGGADPRGWMGQYLCQEPPEHAEAWRITERIMRRLRETVEATGARLFVFTVPTQGDFDERFLRTGLETLGDADAICVDPSRPTRTVVDLLRRQNIEHLDLRPEFQAAMQVQRLIPFHMKKDHHWNETGNALAAEIVSHALAGIMRLPAHHT